ncbi:hypothetical protein [Mycoplasma sp. MV126]|uniref:hypothetical protein n=1 Tax=Mycoplasma sp. MV126 TaxID=3401676 RepID=UPI003AAB9A3B
MQKEKLVPAIRFKGFDEEWKANRLSSYLNVVVKRNEQLRYSQNEVLSVSKDSGVINQIKYLGRSYAGSDLRNYKILELSHIVYTKSPLNETPFGIIKTNNYEQGIVSTLYATYEPSSACHSNFVEHYFSKYDRLNNYLYPLVNKGAKNTLLISDETALGGRVVFPSFDEQQEISDLLDNLALLIHSQELKLEKLQTIKQSLLNKMFASYDQKTPEIRFKGFDEPWKLNKFSELFEEKRVKTTEENEDTLLSCTIDDIYLNSELFSHFRGSSTLGYIKVMKYDLILSAQNLHLGNANVNLKYESGIISPAYKTYKITHSDPHFIQTWVKKENTKKFFLDATTEGASGCRKNVEWNYLYEQFISVPILIHEQQKIGQFFSSLDSLIHSQEQKLEKLNNIKQALLEKMFC